MITKKAFLRYSILVFAICMLCSSFVSAEWVPGTVESSTGMILPEVSLSPWDSATVNPTGQITAITYIIRQANNNVTKRSLPVTGGTVNITNSEILFFRFTGKYTGPKGTLGMLDLYNYGGSYPLNGTKRVDAAIAIPAGSSGTLTSPPYWFGMNNTNNRSYGYTLELFGNKSLILVPITVKVR